MQFSCWYMSFSFLTLLNEDQNTEGLFWQPTQKDQTAPLPDMYIPNDTGCCCAGHTLSTSAGDHMFQFLLQFLQSICNTCFQYRTRCTEVFMTGIKLQLLLLFL